VGTTGNTKGVPGGTKSIKAHVCGINSLSSRRRLSWVWEAFVYIDR